jgi:AAA ATPase domain/AAA domain, putative AbiEii toxin, Type IV TA system
MKILGVRFENFACFDSCYLPLTGGVDLLVGKNNTGKTAILRGLTILKSLPIDPVLPLDGVLAQYARPGAHSFDFHLLFKADRQDYEEFRSGSIFRLRDDPEGRRILDFHFRVFPGFNTVGLVTARFILDDEIVVLLERMGNGTDVLRYQAGPNPMRSQLPATGARAVDGSIWHTFNQAPYLRMMPNFRNTILVSAHRVVAATASLSFVEDLTSNAGSLAPYLDTLQGNDRPKFQEIEKFVTQVFPEFKYVNARKSQNTVSLTLTRSNDGEQILLSHCGTGVEQVLALATFVLTAPTGATILLDEPHSYLHPTAEHDLIAFLLQHKEHSYFISTHSAIMINAVPADRIIALTGPNVTATDSSKSSDVASVLHDLGYRNSDFLFSDRLIFVEGESDQEILPVLLSLAPELKKADIDRTGFPTMGGEGKLRGASKQTSMIQFEKLLAQLQRATLPRIYLFDGDCVAEDQRLLGETPYLKDSGAVVQFLPRMEIENYLLVPDAIAAAMKALTVFSGASTPPPNATNIEAALQTILAKEDSKLYPNGKTDPFKSAKGSVALERLFDAFSLSYNKRTTGKLIAQHVTAGNQPALPEIWSLVEDIFP